MRTTLPLADSWLPFLENMPLRRVLRMAEFRLEGYITVSRLICFRRSRFLKNLRKIQTAEELGSVALAPLTRQATRSRAARESNAKNSLTSLRRMGTRMYLCTFLCLNVILVCVGTSNGNGESNGGPPSSCPNLPNLYAHRRGQHRISD